MIFISETLSTACRWSKPSTKKNILFISKVITFEGTPKFWGMEVWRKWCKERTRWTRSKGFPVGVHDMSQYYFSIYFLRLVIFLLLYHSGKIAIPHYHLFLLLEILHLVLFKSLQRQDELSISGDSRVVFWWARDGNRCLSFLKRADLPFVRNRFVAVMSKGKTEDRWVLPWHNYFLWLKTCVAN